MSIALSLDSFQSIYIFLVAETNKNELKETPLMRVVRKKRKRKVNDRCTNKSSKRDLAKFSTEYSETVLILCM